jgi:acetyl-CoA acetyltransferase
MMTQHVNVIGVGMTPFKTPKRSGSYVEMGRQAIHDALSDAGIDYSSVKQAYASYVYGDSCCGHRVVYEAGLSGIPIFNVNSNCSSGASAFIENGDNTYGGRVVTNPSGGLISKGHPLGATGLAQCFELTSQLRGRADKRQVEDARIALAHNIGIGGACVVTMLGACRT